MYSKTFGSHDSHISLGLDIFRSFTYCYTGDEYLNGNRKFSVPWLFEYCIRDLTGCGMHVNS